MPKHKTASRLEDIVLTVVFSLITGAVMFGCWVIGLSDLLPIW